MAKYSKDSRIQELVEQVLAQGWTIRDGGKHWVLYPADRSHRPIPVPGTPSEYRSYNNFRAQLRRAGGIV
jgi:hypothetical protein